MYLHNNDNTTRYRRHRESSRAARILYSPPQRSETLPDSHSSAAEDVRELTEDEIFSTGDFRRHGNKTFTPPENSGILAALPTESEAPNVKINSRRLSASVSVSSSSSSSSSARMIPLVPRPPKRLLPQASVKFPQSAPVNVPVWGRRNWGEVGSEGEEEKEQEEERLPPHEILARRESPWVACSVLEGSGRTLKGRDLRQVRNAVWRKTGFLD